MPYLGFAFTDRALDFLDGLAPKIRKQVVKKAKALLSEPFPPTAKKLHDVVTPEGHPVYRERSGDYRILYIVKEKPSEIVILDIADRKDVYKMPKTNTKPADEMRMKQSEFELMMRGALSAPAPQVAGKDEEEVKQPDKRLASYPLKRRNG